ncbi:MAG TPA: hypothetical protein VFQ44_03825 [Streptosporangiaceae bacterium]|nr:hypothetical protein [Streptosporangiaceae bacterium]
MASEAQPDGVGADMELFDLRVTVDRIGGRSFQVAHNDRDLSEVVRGNGGGAVGRGLAVDLGRADEVGRVPVARLGQAAELALRVEIVVPDVITDECPHRHVDAHLGELGFDDFGLLVSLEHHGDQGDCLTFFRQELLPRAGTFQRLEQLKVNRSDHHLGALKAVGDRLAARFRAVMHRLYVVEHLPAAPPEGPVVLRHGFLEVGDDKGDLSERIMQTA